MSLELVLAFAEKFLAKRAVTLEERLAKSFGAGYLQRKLREVSGLASGSAGRRGWYDCEHPDHPAYDAYSRLVVAEETAWD